jgi:hypothetical protein
MLAAGRHEQKRFPAPQWLGDSYEKNVTHLSILQPLVRRHSRARIEPAQNRRRGETTMRFMAIVKVTKDSEAGKMPSEELLSAMAKFNEEMVKAGVMLDGNGLQPSSKGARVRFSGDKRTVIDGPFAETKELVAGYWILQCKSLAEAIEWIRRCPNPHNEDSEIEIRQLFELEDFGASEAVEHHRRLGEQIAAKH